MPLSPIPPDPTPTEQDLKPFLPSLEAQFRGYPEVIIKLARLQWYAETKRSNPDRFLAPFATEVPDYAIYLGSNIWENIRDKVLESADHKCSGCGRKATQVHHRDYRPRVLSGEDLTPLVPLCRKCHKWIHTDDNGRHESCWNYTEGRLAKLVSDREKEMADAAQVKPETAKRKSRKKPVIVFDE